MSILLSALLVLLTVPTAAFAGPKVEKRSSKPRIVVLTDIAPNEVEPDDMESMVRLLAHADLFEIEALIATTGWSNTGGGERIDLIHNALDAYEKDLPNLQKRSGQTQFLKNESKQALGYWPSPAYLRLHTVMGSQKMGMKVIGADNDSEGSRKIIALADEKDPRPIWIATWGGANTFAQAIWRVQQERTEEELHRFLQKFRIYTITDQDRPWSRGDTIPYEKSSHQWMRKFGKELTFLWCECAWLKHNETGVKNWDQYALHIQQHGNLGRLYPKYKWGVEGDTPSFLHLIPNGLSNPDIPTQVSWSGYFAWGPGRDNQTSSFTNATGEAHQICARYFDYFYPAAFANFAARMDWAQNGAGNRNPVVIIGKNRGIQPIARVAKRGEVLRIDASKSFDPDGDSLRFRWFIIPEAGSYPGSVTLEKSNSDKVTLHIPSDAAGHTLHLICEVTDNGIHNLAGYRRVIITTR